MKKLIVALCCLFCIKAASAQEIIKLDIDSTSMVKKLVIPNLENMKKLLRASQKDYAATMLSLGYKPAKEDDVDFYEAEAGEGETLFGFTKAADTSVIVIFFQPSDYPKQMKDAFVSQYTNAVHKKSGGADRYYFNLDDGNGGMKGFCMMFDNRKKTSFVGITATD